MTGNQKVSSTGWQKSNEDTIQKKNSGRLVIKGCLDRLLNRSAHCVIIATWKTPKKCVLEFYWLWFEFLKSIFYFSAFKKFFAHERYNYGKSYTFCEFTKGFTYCWTLVEQKKHKKRFFCSFLRKNNVCSETYFKNLKQIQHIKIYKA